METIPELYAMIGASSSDSGPGDISDVERLVNELEAHEYQEGMFLKRYKDLATKSDNRVVKLLLEMVVSDEERHHAVTRAMASTLRGDLNWTRPEDALRGLDDLGVNKEKLLDLTEDFITIEKEGINEYRSLIKESRGYYRDLFVLLFRSMIRDSEKHVEILEFLHDRLKEA
jgi:bacterioferritin (cytochrome b1)